MSSLLQDIRFSFRMLFKNRGITVLAVMALAIGIGANTALFSLIYSVLLSPLPFSQPEKIMFVQTSWQNGGKGSTSGPDYLDWAEQNTVFQNLSAMHTNCKFNLTGLGDPKSLLGIKTTTNFFRCMGNKMFLGRDFLPEEAETGKSHVVILSHRIWKNLFDSDPDIIGKQITLGEEPWIIIGVAPPLMGFIENMAQVYAPLTREELNQNRGSHYLAIVGRLKDGVTMKQAQAGMDVIAKRLAEKYMDSNKGVGIYILPLHQMLVEEIKTAFLILYGAVGFLLLIACVNVANLLLAKAGTRSKEISIRAALGAGRFRIIRQVLTESVVLSSIGGILGLMMALWGMDALRWIAPNSTISNGTSIPGFDEMSINSTILGFTLVLSMVTGILFGLVPALHISKTNLHEMMKDSSRGSSAGTSRHNLLNGLVVAEIALALILLMGAGLLIKSFRNLQLTHPGFNPDHVLAVSMERPFIKENEENKSRAAFYQKLIDQISLLPGVIAVDAINIYPLESRSSDNGFQIEGRPLPIGEYHSAQYRTISQTYFQTMKIPLIQGRRFSSSDTESTKKVIIVNQEFVNRYFPNELPLGKRIDMNGDIWEIVGVVGNTKSRMLNTSQYEPYLYIPISQSCWHEMTILVRTSNNPLALTSAVRQEIWNIDPNQPILKVQTMTQVVAKSVSIQRFSMILLSAMAGVALLLAVIGIYSVMAFSIQDRTHEIGIRMALGAQMKDILLLVIKKGFILTMIGLTIGIAGSVVLTRLLSSMLYQINATDPLTFILVSLVLMVVALLACYIPARRALKIDPMIALRCV